ncbi:iron complex transport system substrate-binding protein [Mesorhizobium sp. J18]|uniref:heme/hemin ABC transporter substrate-binding protein n=1 Tax=Mesorhizobium sp. J18 TaxID=935263 RepID=UPI00119A6B19|nr:ABC transporter substrate-binding protein [Mesorhizobium sp. J18]TWH01213.1 iron complex transport system substrate-binding protein [Mesorhizobium sp. J18]
MIPFSVSGNGGARRLLVTFCLAGLLAVSAGFSARAQEAVEAFADPSRLVSIGGSLTEIIYALGEEEKLIARDSTSIFPQEALELPDVGYMRALSPEGVLSVNPSAILALEGSGPPEAMEVLQKASIPMVLVPETFDLAGIIGKVETVGAALGIEDKAAELAEKIRQDVGAAEALTADVTERKRVLFILSMQGGRILASGTGTAANGIITMAGGVNAITDYQGYKQLTDEAIIEARPDVVLMMDRGGDLDPAGEDVLAHPALASTPAAKNKALVRMDGAYLLGFGPRTASAVRDLSTALYGASIAN